MNGLPYVSLDVKRNVDYVKFVLICDFTLIRPFTYAFYQKGFNLSYLYSTKNLAIYFALDLGSLELVKFPLKKFLPWHSDFVSTVYCGSYKLFKCFC